MANGRVSGHTLSTCAARSSGTNRRSIWPTVSWRKRAAWVEALQHTGDSLRTPIIALVLATACAGHNQAKRPDPRTGALPSNLDSEPAIAIEHATVIDVQTGERKGDQTILIAGNHIAGVASATSFVVPARARRVDGTGSFVIPGLWEMHAHTYRSLDLVGALYLANGVTGIRDMGSRIGEQPVLALRDSIRAGRVPGPRMVVAGGLPPPSPAGAPSSGEPITEKNVRAAVDSLA